MEKQAYHTDLKHSSVIAVIESSQLEMLKTEG